MMEEMCFQSYGKDLLKMLRSAIYGKLKTQNANMMKA